MTERGEEHDSEQAERAPSASGADPISDAGLGELRDRLGELQDRVELLGSQGIWPEPASPPPLPEPGWGAEGQGGYDPGPAYGNPLPAPEPPPEVYGQPPPFEPPPEVYGQPPPFEPPPPAYGAEPPPYGAESPAYGTPPAWQQPHPGEPEAASPPPPVATNGHSEDPAEVSARSTTVALVDAGPFDDLIQLRHFEDDLASLTAVRDVRVRRFGHGRASIEVGMTGPYALSRELYRLDRQMSVTDGDAGDLIIDLAPPPEQPAAEDDEGTEQPAEPIEREAS